MRKKLVGYIFCWILFQTTALAQQDMSAQEGRQIIQASVDLWRGTSSYSEMSMTIHRSDWQRPVSLKGWTLGENQSLVRVTAPAADIGNATLLLGEEMWSYSPKINRVIKIPSSLMGQSWMGSDFTNKDLAHADEIIDEYEHRLLEVLERDGRQVYRIESIPHETAAVVWGKQILLIRDDYLLLEEDFYDQDGELVKKLKTMEISEFDGRVVASRQRMTNWEEPERWTEILIHTASYGIDLSPAIFTQANLRNPRE